MDALRQFVPDQIWVKEWPVHFAGIDILTRMTVIRMADGVILHSPVEIDAATRDAIERIGPVRAIIAPSIVHHVFVPSAQHAFPDAPLYGIEGLEKKREDLHFTALIGEEPPPLWAGQLDQVTIGNRVMREVDFLHRASRTLILTDLVENFQDRTPGTNAFVRALLEVAGMWNHPRPAPELRLLTIHREAARNALEKLLSWDFDRATIAHGELLDRDPQAAIREAWSWILD
ncbi:MAG: DUF4336 domain-containing protein [Deltaproteobacteria bacterium]